LISSYKTLSWRYLKDNKKRTILTIIGIILSVALITSICTFIVTVQNSMLENTKKTIGAFHIAITNVSEDEINKIETNPKVNSIGVMASEDAVPFIKNKNIQLNYLNEAAFKLMNVNLEEGQLPKKDNEIVIERWILRYFNEEIKVGDVVKIQDETGNERSYILSGIAKDDWKNQSEGISKAYLIKNSSVIKENSTVLVEINEKDDKQEVISEISNLVSGKSKVNQNKDLLRLTGESSNGELNRSIYSVVFIVIGIVVLATVVVIYNAFHISIAERMKQFGLLRAIGTTKKQIMTLVIREASIMILIGIPLGLFFGIVSVYCIVFTFSKISGFGDFSNLKVVISPLALLISGGVGAVTIYFSAYLPARSAGKISPLIAISGQSLIKKEKKNKSGKFLGRFLKIDTAIALKNVKRNKRRFYVTVLSMAISVTLFVAFTSFAKFSDNFAEKVTEDNNIAFSISNENYNTDGSQATNSEIIEEVKSIPGIKEIYINYKYILTEGFVDNSAIPEEVRQWASENDSEDLSNNKVDGENKSKVRVVFQAYEDNKLEASKKYIKEGSIDNLKDGEVIIVRETKFFGEKRSLIAPMAKLKVGDEILISNAEYSDGEKEFNSKDLKKVKVAAIVDVQPFNSVDYQGTLNVIGSKETVKNIIEGNPQQMEDFKINGMEIKISDESYVDKIDESLKKIENTNAELNYYNKIEAAKSDKAFKLQISILLMGFTIVIALISAVNIVNTVTTNILLRSKEIAALKAIGMTRKQVKKMITFEGVLFGLYGGIIGSILGTILSYVLYNPMSNIRDFKFILPWESIVIAIIAVIIMGYVSALIPLRRLSKENIIDSIRGE